MKKYLDITIIGNNIYRFRKLSGLSQKQLSQMLKVSRKTVVLWENYKSIPNLRNVISFCNLFEIKMDTFLMILL